MIAYYAHHHGNGHSNFADQFVRSLPEASFIITSSKFNFNTEKVVKITDEHMPDEVYENSHQPLPEYAHYLPKNHLKLAVRNKEITNNIIKHNISLALIDVSVETAAIFKLSGVPYAYRRMIGDRNDQAHNIAYKAAEFLFAYYPKELESKNTENWVVNKTIYTGFLSRFKFVKNHSFEALKNKNLSNLKILVIAGMGGTTINETIIQKIAIETGSFNIQIIGGISAGRKNNSDQINYLGYQNNIKDIIENNDVIISSCGLNLSSEILALKNKFIAIPEERPFFEQELFCQNLVANKLAIRFNPNNIKQTLIDFINLSPNPNIENYFGNMKSFTDLENIQKYAKCEKVFQ